MASDFVRLTANFWQLGK